MEKRLCVLVPLLAFGAAAYGQTGGSNVDVDNNITTVQKQNINVSSGSGNSDSWSDSTANVNITSNGAETRTPPLTSLPPYLPYWTHGGWGTVKAYFPNGPSLNDQIYETTFDPEDPEDMRELRSVLKALPHEGLLAAAGGVLNSVAVALFGAPDTYFHGRGLQIVDAVIRDRRPEGKPLLVFIDSNVDTNLLREEGYAYVGKISLEGDTDRNWDHTYKAAISQALLWDVDILLLSGGMKGVTVGTNVSFPSAAGGYSQVNYSLSLFGAKAEGITEGKGKAILSAEAYRFYPEMVERRRIPASVYERIRLRPRPVMLNEPQPGAMISPAPSAAPMSMQQNTGPGIHMSRELYDLAGFSKDQTVGCVNLH